jgi:hypothetical protein
LLASETIAHAATSHAHTTSHATTASHTAPNAGGKPGTGTHSGARLSRISLAHSIVVGHIGTARRREATLPELIDHVPYTSGTTRDNLDPRRRENLVSVGPAGTGENMRHSLRSDHLSRLDSCTTAQRRVLVLDSLKTEIVSIDDQKILAPSKPPINPCVK